jgi:hypothetical protein
MRCFTKSSPPRKVILFSGHMIDAPGRREARFPADKENLAAQAISGVLDKLCVGSSDLAISSGACGGDLLFAEAALLRNTSLELYIPYEEPRFLKTSVEFAGDVWRNRFFWAKSHAILHILPVENGFSNGYNPYEQVNLWMLERAERYGADKVEFICLWNGQSGDGRGGAGQLMTEVRKRGCRVHWLDTTRLWH